MVRDVSSVTDQALREEKAGGGLLRKDTLLPIIHSKSADRRRSRGVHGVIPQDLSAVVVDAEWHWLESASGKIQHDWYEKCREATPYKDITVSNANLVNFVLAAAIVIVFSVVIVIVVIVSPLGG